MSSQEILIEEMKGQPEPVVREVLHYLNFIKRQRVEEEWSDVLPENPLFIFLILIDLIFKLIANH